MLVAAASMNTSQLQAAQQCRTAPRPDNRLRVVPAVPPAEGFVIQRRTEMGRFSINRLAALLMLSVVDTALKGSVQSTQGCAYSVSASPYQGKACQLSHMRLHVRVSASRD